MCGRGGMSSVDEQRSLISQAKRGDRSALEQLLLSYAPKISNHIARRLPQLEGLVTVDDILQETLLNAFLGIHKLDQTSPRSFSAWLKAIADMRLLDALKAHGRQKRGGKFHQVRHAPDMQRGKLVDLIDLLPADISTASRQLARREAVIAIHVGMAGLPAEQRTAIQLHYLEGKSVEETATALDRSPSAVRSLIHRGKRNLAEALSRASLWLSR